MNNKITYIFGHKNPDCDSICAAISLSYLKNQLGYETIPAALGDPNPETKFALDKFGFKHLHHLNDVKLQIKDVNYHRGCFIDKNLSIKDAFDYMNKYSLTGIPVVENKDKYYGYVSLKEIAREIINGDYHKINTSFGNILNILKGEKILKFDKEIIGNVLSSTYAKETFLEKVDLTNDSIVVCGDRKTILEYAIDCKVKLIIMVAGTKPHSDLLSKARNNKVNIISTEYGSYDVSKLISLSNYIKNFMREEESATFLETEYLSDFIEKSRTLKHTNYPILNNKNECRGLLTLTDVNEVNKKKVILVDHNNFSQSVDGLDEAEILEIIDHHNIGDIVTKKPINFRNSSCGCCSTIIYEMFKEQNVAIPKEYAGLLCSAIISDTLLLTSPTTTSKDKEALIELAKLAKVNYKTYGLELLKRGMSTKGLTCEQLLHKDFKNFKIDNHLVGVGQLLITDYDSIKPKVKELVEYINEVAKENNYKILCLFMTNIFENTSYCLYNESAEDLMKSSFKVDKMYEGVPMKGIVSRKIQIIPNIMDTLEK